MRLFRPRPSDDEFVETLRRSLVFWDRWRWVAAVFYIVVILLLIGFFDRFIRRLVGFVPGGNPNAVWGGFLIGAVIGLGFGAMVQGLLHQLTMAISGFRAERLLIAHYQSSDTREESDHTSGE